ncbi:MAG: hypothetical protein ABIJ97_12735 [Bacteroidota bacterium]
MIKMNFFLTGLAIVLISGQLFSQTAASIDYEINALKTKKKDVQLQIKQLQTELQKINSDIDALEAKKTALNTSPGTISATVNSLEGILRSEPSSLGTEIANIKEGEKITVFREHDGLYLKVSYMGKTGWLNYSSISGNPEVDKILNENKQQDQNTSTTVVRTVDTNDPKYLRLSKLYGKDKAMKIMNGEVFNGMSQGMVIESLGQPSSKKSVNTLDGAQEIWTYAKKEVVFLNGEVNSWTDK